MKKKLTLILTFVFVNILFSQSNDKVNKLADAAVKSFTWDIETMEKGTLMFLDVPYLLENIETPEFLTLTVAKDKSKERPKFISVIIPNNIVRSNGIFIKFANEKMELEKGNPIRLPFENCDDEICTARIMNGFASEENGTNVDLFDKFLHFNHVLFLFVYPDGSHKSVAIPLFSFKEQYKKLQ
ncbi:MAG: hypothetical protein V4548_06905 [Bacteroidota bacterium]